MNADPKIPVVSKRNPSNDNSGGLTAGDNLHGYRLLIPHGVYRFKTHEEADAWMEKMLARSKQAGHRKP